MVDANQSDAASEALVFSAVLRPYRSLSPRGFGLLMGAIGLCTFAVALAFWLMGAWPVVGFCGLDLLLIQLAFRLNYRSARAAEEVSLTRDRLSVVKISPRGDAIETGFNPYWARLEIDRHPDIGVTALRIASHGARLAIGSFLPPSERESFAAAFSAALAKVRSAAA
jgi:uncharacterized membrane protein